jgi:hypothetical protein
VLAAIAEEGQYRPLLCLQHIDATRRINALGHRCPQLGPTYLP